MGKAAKKKISFDIDPDLLEKVNQYCKQKDITRANFIRKAIEDELSKAQNLVNLYVIKNDELQPATIDINQYNVKKDEDIDINSLIRALGFVEKGYLIPKNNKKEKIRYYSKHPL